MEGVFLELARMISELSLRLSDWLFARRNVISVVEMLFWPVVGMLSIGLLSDFLKLDRSTQSYILTGAIALGSLQVSQLDVAYALLHDIWSKSVKAYVFDPYRDHRVSGRTLAVGIARGTVVFLLLVVFSMKAFNFYLLGWWPTIILLSGIFLSALLMGGLVCVLILQFGQKAEISAWAFAYLFILLAGIYYSCRSIAAFFYRLSLIIH